MTHQGALQNSKVQERLRWRCRRGMLELDLLLLGFLERHYAALPDIQQRAFQALLCHPDEVLLAWLLGRESPTDGVTADVVAKIRRAAAS
ncbi:MAG: succinate dehydrogenase assembly factor 2 [Gammaproteobacteria bacterium]|nr:succinate dehydrogenase assembly factor 2 [Gammaproteobacteria bacterium]